MEAFTLDENHQLVACLIMLCKMSRQNDPLAYAQYKAHLEQLERIMMKEFDDEDLGNISSH